MLQQQPQRGPIATVKTSSSSPAKELPSVHLINVADAVALPLEPLTEVGDHVKMRLTRTSAVPTLPQPRSEPVHPPGERPTAKLLASHLRREIGEHARPTAEARHASSWKRSCRIMPSTLQCGSPPTRRTCHFPT